MMPFIVKTVDCRTLNLSDIGVASSLSSSISRSACLESVVITLFFINIYDGFISQQLVFINILWGFIAQYAE